MRRPTQYEWQIAAHHLKLTIENIDDEHEEKILQSVIDWIDARYGQWDGS